ncbi:SigE family RNA polymerase sigma factor [Winogradskya consettensis]|uniref:SigE family RNA polymerase sigma factor n=1 Tax=Winogradskya consettensis TaxID=113560 RepID=UPI001BB3BF6C|nr:SigE family RNA polymerase sigma factor [Actinoplanes consettensis]
MSDRDTEFRNFVTAQMEPLRGLAYLTCGDWQAAEDAVLTVLAKLYVKWRRIDNPGAYARTAVVRAAIDETRRPWWRREHAQSDAMPDRAHPVDATSSVDERLRIRAALQKVPARLRAVLTLRYLEGLSVQETAEALGCPEGTIKSYTSRGLEALRNVLGAEVFVNKENHREARAV